MRRGRIWGWKLLLSFCMVAGVFAGNVMMASPAAAALPNCSTAFLGGLLVGNVSVTSATDVPAANGVPEYCEVVVALTTNGEGAGLGLAHVQLKLPATWNNRFLFLGCGGECGSINSVSAESVDTNEALPKGYAVVNTDTGHTDPTNRLDIDRTRSSEHAGLDGFLLSRHPSIDGRRQEACRRLLQK